MVRAVYALLVGIDQYRPPVRPLGGCVNDIGVMETFLRERVGAENGKLELRVLRNEEATREAVIAGFREHLRKAGSEDVALFYHSGHGSQERTPPEFLYLEPDGLDETLVCYDSRTEGHWDLADKELSKLIWEVAERNPHVVVVLDSCHSGSGTRAPEEEDVVRRVPTDERERPISSFIVTAEEAKELSSQRGKAEDTTGWVALPQGRHVLLSACRADEESKEQTLGGARRGVFSYFLTDTLQQTGESLLYRDLFKRVSALVRNRVARQSPQIEATSLQDLDRPFLGGAIAPRSPSFTLSYDPSYGWVIDGGAVHGIPRVTAGETTILALFPFTSSLEQLRDLSSSLGDARVTDVQPHLSRAEVKLRDGGRPDPEQTYKAIVTALPLPLTGVRIEGDEEGVKLVREALVKANPDEGPSLYVREDNTDQKELRLVAGGDKYRIMRAADARSLVLDIQGYTAGSARQAVERLEHIARWLRTAELANPTSRIPADAVRLEVYREDPSAIGGDQPKPEDLAESGGQLRLEYEYRDGKWQQPRVWIKLVNTSNERLYCALLDLTQKYAVKANLVTGEWQDGHQETWALSGKPVYVSVPVDLWQQGVTEYRDLLKLIVSTDQFDATLLEQEALDVSVDRSERATRGFERMSTLNRLMRRVQMRDAGSEPEGNEAYADWNASEIGITTVRPLESVQVPEAGKTAPLGAGVTVVGHASLKARARLTTASQASRDLGTIVLPRLLRDDPSVSQPFEFSASRGGEAGLSVLELLDIDDPAVVTPAQPLLLRVATTLQDDEHVLPVGYDGEFFLPLGYTRGAGSATEIEIERLPPPESVRDLKGSVRIFFQKVISTHLGLEYQYPLLAATDLADDGEVRYTEGLDAVRARVERAGRILLCVHGIIGDTRGMAASAHRLNASPQLFPHPLIHNYDLILAFDYENINTSIEQTAQDLKQRLQAIGLGPGHRKELHIIAHSMGGLVSRWLIEREGGNQLVQQLVMLGTPNAGSPWPTLQKWATIALGIGLNSLTAVAWPAKVLGVLVGAVEKVDTTMHQMEPGSDFLKSLDASPDPGVPYAIIAGNTSIIGTALEPAGDKQTNKLGRLLSRLCPRELLYGATGLVAFFGQPNDIAVSVDSIEHVLGGRSLKPEIHEVACDHLTYFSSEVGGRALAGALEQESAG